MKLLVFSEFYRMLRNNLSRGNYDISGLSDELLQLRAQQMDMEDFLALWDKVRTSL